VAYDQLTGQRRWTALNDTAGYSSPMAVELAGVPHLLVFTASRLAALTPDGSHLLWEYPWTTSFDVNASQPLMLGGDRIFLSSGYGTGAAVIRVAHSDGRLVVRELWRNTRMKNKFTSSVVQNGYIYGLDAGILACVDAATGELQWKGGRYGFGQVVLASEHLIVLTEDGDLALVKATPSAHIEVSRSPALTGKSWNHPAIVDGILLVRSVSEMAAFDLRTITVP
jgi:outer membrane protein assembly factor BamB